MARKETTSKKKIFHGVMKRAVEIDVDHVNIVDHQPDIKEQDGRHPPVEEGSGRRRPASKQQDGQ